ncbi:holin-like protein [Andreprevotia lacus DSM 23236]|jgi:holin-like protein|uniref:Holin-like protein n=1 Tax=Andreprevotia lacus DSM 23236 TaxID=1121001 RepID=A0A1W1WX43_9NEIS|nr:CidA/LrgA family protein [Andreprevotia lacus]SMC15988.1 holin-like protein [Andreprevotia lacus DSM 23236]
MLYGITLLIVFQLLGELLSQLLHLPLPGPVLGMLLLAAWCMLRRGVDERVAKVAQALLGYLGLLFVPAGVGIIALDPQVRAQGWPMLAVLVLSTLITLAVTALLLKWLLRHRP